jgi:hypothetical protein
MLPDQTENRTRSSVLCDSQIRIIVLARASGSLGFSSQVGGWTLLSNAVAECKEVPDVIWYNLLWKVRVKNGYFADDDDDQLRS